jgi:hypothetical protein
VNKLQKWSGIAALFEAAAYITGMLFFILIVDYFSVVDPVQRVVLFVDNQTIFYLLNLIIYVIFGIFMVVLSIGLYEKLKAGSPALMQVATAFGIIWAAVVIASGMIFNIGMETVIDLFDTDPVQAGTVWLAIESVVDGIGGGNEIVGGLWILLLSWAAIQTKGLPKGLNIMGMAVGIAGIISMAPPLGLISGLIFGLGQIVWFIWLGIVMLRSNGSSAG